MFTFKTNNNQDVHTINLTHCDEIMLNGCSFVDLDHIKWPNKPFHLHCNFRPSLPQLKSVIYLESLSFMTQHEVWRKDLPINLRKLYLTCPACNPTLFELETDSHDEFYFSQIFYISQKDFNKYNQFKKSWNEYECDNIVDWHMDDETMFQWYVEGDPKTREEGIDWHNKSVKESQYAF